MVFHKRVHLLSFPLHFPSFLFNTLFSWMIDISIIRLYHFALDFILFFIQTQTTVAINTKTVAMMQQLKLLSSD